MLRTIFGSKRDKVTGEWRKLHNEERNDLCCSSTVVPVIKSRLRCAGDVARMGKGRGVYRVLVGKPEGKKSLGRPMRRLEDNIKADLRKLAMDWIELANYRNRWRALMNAVMNLRVPSNAWNILTSYKPVSLSRRILLHGVSKCVVSSTLNLL
jgi:hypothetical protein